MEMAVPSLVCSTAVETLWISCREEVSAFKWKHHLSQSFWIHFFFSLFMTLSGSTSKLLCTVCDKFLTLFFHFYFRVQIDVCVCVCTEVRKMSILNMKIWKSTLRITIIKMENVRKVQKVKHRCHVLGIDQIWWGNGIKIYVCRIVESERTKKLKILLTSYRKI